VTGPLVWTGGDPELATERFALDSGLEVVVHSDPTVPRVAVNVWYRVGSSDEGCGSSGFAHLYEHLFKESIHLAGRRHYEVLREAGATGANASTSSDRTAYHETMPAEALDLALWLEADRMGYFLPALDDARLARQQAVVREERRQRYETAPYGAELLAMAEALWPEGHPHRYLTIGRHEDIEAATLERVADFYRTWYVPANATLVLAGDVEPAAARAAVARWFGTFPRSARPVRPEPRATPPAAPVTVVVEDPFATLPRIHRAWHGPPAWGDGGLALQMLTRILARPGTGRLWRRLVHDGRLARRVSVWRSSDRLAGVFHVAVDALGDADLGAVRGILDEELAAATAVADDLAAARAVRQREAGVLWRLDGLGRRADQLQSSMLYLGRPDGLAEELARVRAVDGEAVRAAAAAHLRPEAMVEVETVPRRRA
jgi:zinc protease